MKRIKIDRMLKNYKNRLLFSCVFIFLEALFSLVDVLYESNDLSKAFKNCLYYSGLDFSFGFSHMMYILVYIEPEANPTPLLIQGT